MSREKRKKKRTAISEHRSGNKKTTRKPAPVASRQSPVALSDSALPTGMTCRDCAHLALRMQGTVGICDQADKGMAPSATSCDFAPSRFQERVPVASPQSLVALSDSALPTGKTCRDCTHLAMRAMDAVGICNRAGKIVAPNDAYCDLAPSRFQERAPVASRQSPVARAAQTGGPRNRATLPAPGQSASLQPAQPRERAWVDTLRTHWRAASAEQRKICLSHLRGAAEVGRHDAIILAFSACSALHMHVVTVLELMCEIIGGADLAIAALGVEIGNLERREPC